MKATNVKMQVAAFAGVDSKYLYILVSLPYFFLLFLCSLFMFNYLVSLLLLQSFVVSLW